MENDKSGMDSSCDEIARNNLMVFSSRLQLARIHPAFIIFHPVHPVRRKRQPAILKRVIRRPTPLALFLCGAVILALWAPLISLYAGRVLERPMLGRCCSTALVLRLTVSTLVLCVITALLASLLGVPLGFLIARGPRRARVLVAAGCALPLGVPAVLAAAPFFSLGGRSGWPLVPVAPYEHVERIRASINVLGPLLARCGRVRLSMPGGDDFGARPIDLHVAGLEAMGADFKFAHGDVEATADRLRGADISFPFPSVGATENLLCAAVYAHGVTTLENAAMEPEVVDLCELLVDMGAGIDGVGTSRLRITGVEPGSLHAAPHRTVPDRVQTATYLAALGVTTGRLLIEDARPEHLANLLEAFVEMGMRIDATAGGLLAQSAGRLRSVDIQTLPYPGIATDYKPLVITLLSVADSVGIVTENIYPGRFRYVEELARLGADIRIAGHHAVVRGVPRLSGAPVRAHDIRAGAAMVVAGLAAEGETVIGGVRHIDRGYDDLVGRLRGVGADIVRRNETVGSPVE